MTAESKAASPIKLARTVAKRTKRADSSQSSQQQAATKQPSKSKRKMEEATPVVDEQPVSPQNKPPKTKVDEQPVSPQTKPPKTKSKKLLLSSPENILSAKVSDASKTLPKAASKSQKKSPTTAESTTATAETATAESLSSPTQDGGGLASVEFAVHDESCGMKTLTEWMKFWKVVGVVFVIFPKASTAGCTKQCKAFSAIELPANVKAVGVSFDSKEAQEKFSTTSQLNIPLVYEGAEELVHLLNAKSSSDGKIVRSVVYVNNLGQMLYEKHKVKPELSASEFTEFMKTSLMPSADQKAAKPKKKSKC